MGRTIIQPIGPLYGEAVNGTVFGRPNGSIYIPDTNQISLSIRYQILRNYTGTGWRSGSINTCNTLGNYSSLAACRVVAKSQDNAAYIRMMVSDDPDFDTANTAYYDLTAGEFNNSTNYVVGLTGKFTIVEDETYYVKAVLMSSTNVPVATSETIECTGKVYS